MVIHSLRGYGEPKLVKPKELKGITQSHSLPYNKTKVSVFLPGDGKIWLRFRDFFSPSMETPKHLEGSPLPVLIKELMEVKRHTKNFIYSDSWGDIVLRQEAWLIVKGYFKDYRDVYRRLRDFEKVIGVEEFELGDTGFSRLMENFIKK